LQDHSAAELLGEVVGVDHAREAPAHGRIRSSKLVERTAFPAFKDKVMKLAGVRHGK
jgi:hypothetical protein